MVKKRIKEEKSIETGEEKENKEEKESKTKIFSISLPISKKVLLPLIAVAVVVIILLASGIITGNVSKAAVSEKAVEFFKTYQGVDITVDSIEKVSGLYKLEISLSDGRSGTIFMSKDGKYIGSMSSIEEIEETSEEEEEPQEIPKSDKPKVELFVMSHCPYGTQAEKGILPAAELLADKIDFSIKFVYYAMHGEKEIKEETNQYCIQKEQNDKFFDYLSCFLKEGKTDECLNEAKIDKNKLDLCVDAADKEFRITENLENKSLWLNGAYPLFDVYKEDNEKYNIGGSPTLVINGAQSNAGRDSASYLAAICNAFSDMPEECNQQLSSVAPSAGFGYSEGSGSSGGSCG